MLDLYGTYTSPLADLGHAVQLIFWSHNSAVFTHVGLRWGSGLRRLSLNWAKQPTKFNCSPIFGPYIMKKTSKHRPRRINSTHLLAIIVLYNSYTTLFSTISFRLPTKLPMISVLRRDLPQRSKSWIRPLTHSVACSSTRRGKFVMVTTQQQYDCSEFSSVVRLWRRLELL